VRVWRGASRGPERDPGSGVDATPAQAVVHSNRLRRGRHGSLGPTFACSFMLC